MSLNRASRAAFPRHLYQQNLVGDEGMLGGHICRASLTKPLMKAQVSQHSPYDGLKGIWCSLVAKAKPSAKAKLMHMHGPWKAFHVEIRRHCRILNRMCPDSRQTSHWHKLDGDSCHCQPIVNPRNCTALVHD